MGMVLRVAGLTDVGQEREHNEDNFGLFPKHSVFLVADGMGGHLAGDIASQEAVEAVEEFYTLTEKADITWPFHFDPEQPFSINRMVTAIQVANNKIFQESSSNEKHHGMGTTIVAINLTNSNKSCHIAHVGDSRCYRIRDDSIELMTMDHSLVNDYIKAAPDMTEEQLAELPTNVITRALGMQDKVEVDVQTHETVDGDIFLMCSDGLNGMLDDSQMLEITKKHSYDVDETAKALINQANDNGGEDNVTVVMVKVVEE